MTNRWESEYRAGRWAYLKGLQEAARYGVVSAHLRHTMPPGALLDVGCGEAILAGYLARDRVTRYVGVDISQAALDLAQLPRDWGRLVCSPLEDYAPDSGERFTAIIFNEVLFFTDQPGAMLERYRGWLAPDGVLIVSMYQTPRPESGARRSVEAVWSALDGPGWTALDEVSLTNVTKQLTWRLPAGAQQRMTDGEIGAPIERRLVPADLAAAFGLSTAAGWNQVEDDWRVMLALGQGIGLVAPRSDQPADGALVATALTVPLGERLAWISMVLVEAAWRRRGLGTRLLQRCIAELSARGVIAGLDATPAGRLVYAPLGFQALYGISRLFIEPAADSPVDMPRDIVLRPLSAADLAALAPWDAARSLMRRDPLLADLQHRLPAAAWLATRADRIAGFVLGRNGRLSNQIGPIMADDAPVAQALLAGALRATRRAAILDIPDHHAGLQGWLHGQGAVTQRGYTRMLLGPIDTLPRPDPLFAIAGPELG